MSLRFKPAIFAGFFLRAEDGYAGRSASKAADFRHLRRKAEKFLFLALFFILYMNEDEGEYELFIFVCRPQINLRLQKLSKASDLQGCRENCSRPCFRTAFSSDLGAGNPRKPTKIMSDSPRLKAGACFDERK